MNDVNLSDVHDSVVCCSHISLPLYPRLNAIGNITIEFCESSQHKYKIIVIFILLFYQIM